MKLTASNIRALGTFLSSYHSDLTFIDNFQKHKNKAIPTVQYVQSHSGMFKSFINDWRVARNIPFGNTRLLLTETMKWVKTKKADDVDGFAEFLKLKCITHEDKTMTSLASKILFLNNPWAILPFDNLAKKTLQQRTNKYNHYLVLLNLYKTERKDEVEHLLSTVETHLSVIENDFKELPNIKTIRHNRFVDKLLWSGGKI